MVTVHMLYRATVPKNTRQAWIACDAPSSTVTGAAPVLHVSLRQSVVCIAASAPGTEARAVVDTSCDCALGASVEMTSRTTANDQGPTRAPTYVFLRVIGVNGR